MIISIEHRDANARAIMAHAIGTALLNQHRLASDLLDIALPSDAEAKLWHLRKHHITITTRQVADEPGIQACVAGELHKDLDIARRAAQKHHRRIQELESENQRLKAQLNNSTGSEFMRGYRAGNIAAQERSAQMQLATRQECEQKLAAYKFATRSELRRLRADIDKLLAKTKTLSDTTADATTENSTTSYDA